MRSRLHILVLALVLGLIAAACGGDDQGQEQEQDQASSDDQQTDQPGLQEPVDLPDGVAAIVDGEELTDETVDRRVEGRLDALAESDVEGAQDVDPEEAREPLAAQVLTFMISHRVIVDAGQEMGIEITEEDLEEARQTAIDETGSEEQLQAAVDQQGITEQEFDELLELQATIQQVREELGAEEPSAPQTPGATPQPDPLEEWLVEQFNEAEVEVDEQYGRWDPSTGQVVPEQPATTGGTAPPSPAEQ